jgi:hypothetical protein
MERLFWGCVLFAGLAGAMTGTAQAQFFSRPFHDCCETCELPHAQCSCTQTRPVIQTQLRAQQVTTFRDVTETHVRNETTVENIPSTTYHNVTVDEGGYQMVWVPKPVTKQIAQTVMQQQVKTRAIPYQVTRRVPQVSTQLVPVQTVHHITETVPVQLPITALAIPAPIAISAVAASCDPCGGPSMAMPYLSTQIGYSPSFVPAAPVTASIPTMPAITVPLPQTALAPAPSVAPPISEQWQTVPARGPSVERSRNYDSPASSAVPTPMDEANRGTRRTSMFVPAPTAATVWNSRRDSSLR